jgi:ABC-type antimicrobial peptide transport system permease subunit
VLGVSDANRVLREFGWTATRSEHEQVPDLYADLGVDVESRPILPVVLDLNTAMYSLHLSGAPGDRLTILDGDDQPATLEVVGLLKNSILQGDLIIGDASFRHLYPRESGSRLFLIRDSAAAGNAPPLEAILENRLSDYGFAVGSTADRLASFLAVQNTYLTTFQTLGGLGLLLGTMGLAVVQLRGVLERRGELALLQAVGFRRPRIAWLVMVENLLLLAGGLVTGGMAALLALLPQLGLHDASLPWGTMAMLLLAILVVGSLATWLATRRTLHQPILSALRGN